MYERELSWLGFISNISFINVSLWIMKFSIFGISGNIHDHIHDNILGANSMNGVSNIILT